MRVAADFVLDQKRGCVLSSFVWIILIVFVLKRTGKEMGGHGIKWGLKSLLDLDYADDLSILDESVSKMNEFLQVLIVQGAKIGLNTNVKKTKSLRLRRLTRWLYWIF